MADAWGGLKGAVREGEAAGAVGACGAAILGAKLPEGMAAVGDSSAGLEAAAALGVIPIGLVTDIIILLAEEATGVAPVGGLRGFTGIAAIGCPAPGLGGRLIRMVSFLSFFCVVLRFGEPWELMLIVSLGMTAPAGMMGFWAIPEGGGVGNLAPVGKLGFGGKGGVAICFINKSPRYAYVNHFLNKN